MEPCLVQILVVVATIQMRTLKTEVEKGSMRTAFGHGLLDPKAKDNSLVHVQRNACLFWIGGGHCDVVYIWTLFFSSKVKGDLSLRLQ